MPEVTAAAHADYRGRSERLRAQLVGQDVLGLAKPTSNLFRDRGGTSKRRLDVSEFTHVLEVNPTAGWVEAEGMVTYEALVEACLRQAVPWCRSSRPSRSAGPRRGAAPFVAALYPGADYPDGADGGLQSASFRRPATLSLAAAKPRPAPFERVDHDPGIDRQYAGRAVRRRHRGRRETAASGID